MQYKRVISFGDSFTWGSELSDEVCVPPLEVYQNPDKYPREYQILVDRKIAMFSETTIDHKTRSITAGYSNLTWPALLAKDIDAEYYCHAWPGSGNQSIVRNIMKIIKQIKATDLIVINWTYISRWDFYDATSPQLQRRWKTVRPGGETDAFSEVYFKYIQSEFWDKWETLRNILTVTCLLKNKNIDFIMTCLDPLVFDKQHHIETYVLNAQEEIKDDIVWFNGKGFYDWAVEHGFPIGKENGHPLEEAHQAAFEYIRDNYDFTK